MKTLTCKHCGKTFDAKRSNASYCSDKCRTSAFYQKKNPHSAKKNISSAVFQENEQSIVSKKVHISGSIDFAEIKCSIMSFEQELKNSSEKVEQLSAKNNQVLFEIKEISEELVLYENDRILRLEQRLYLPDDVLYNRYLNKDYLEAKQKDNNPETKLVSLSDIQQSYFGKIMRNDILVYREKLENKIAEYNAKIQKMKTSVPLKEKEMETNRAEIKQCRNTITFLQNRIFSYDKLLTGT